MGLLVRVLVVVCLGVGAIVIGLGAQAKSAAWPQTLYASIAAIDADMPGNLGVYVKRLSDDTDVRYHADRPWYLASTTKVLVAIALLQKVEEGKLTLEDTVVLEASDYVDGGGSLLWQEPGAEFTYAQLLERMLTQSDSTAADILMGAVGIDELNHRVRARMGADDFGPITTLLQVRRDAYGEIHPSARALTNRDFIELVSERSREARFAMLLSKLGARPDEARADSIEDAFERYYERGLNSATLRSFGGLLERLEEGRLLSAPNTELLLRLMEGSTTGETRIKAGLPGDVRFAQKTGTQIGRICNVGILRERARADKSVVVVAACAEKFSDRADAEAALAKLGTAITRSGIFLQ